MSNQKSDRGASSAASTQQPEEDEAAGNSWMSDSQNDETTKPGQNAAVNAEDSKVLQKGVGDGS